VYMRLKQPSHYGVILLQTLFRFADKLTVVVHPNWVSTSAMAICR
jgi:hypothetical protein